MRDFAAGVASRLINESPHVRVLLLRALLSQPLLLVLFLLLQLPRKLLITLRTTA